VVLVVGLALVCFVVFLAEYVRHAGRHAPDDLQELAQVRTALGANLRKLRQRVLPRR
jgi:hypothetical protein